MVLLLRTVASQKGSLCTYKERTLILGTTVLLPRSLYLRTCLKWQHFSVVLKMLLILLSIFSSVSSQDLADSKWLEEARSYSDLSAKASRYDWTGVTENPECPGNVITLNPGDATRIKSHKSFGKESYPDDYRVSLLIGII